MFRKKFLDSLRAGLLVLLSLTFIQCGKNHSASSSSGTSKPSLSNTSAPQEGQYAGTLFGVPVPIGNYYFAKRVHLMFQTPEEKKMTPEQMEKYIWHNLVLSYESAQRKTEVTDKEFDEWVDSVLGALNVKLTRTKDPEQYKKWVTDTLKESVELFENQMRYLASIEKLKRNMVNEMKVTVSEKEMRDDFENVQKHVGGEFRLLETKAEADTFYEDHIDITKWEEYKKQNADKIRPFMLITEQAIIDLWGVPKDQIDAFHALPIGTVGKPMPFGTQWGVFRLLEKREVDNTKYDAEKDNLKKRVEARKKYQAAQDWIAGRDEVAKIQVFLTPEQTK